MMTVDQAQAQVREGFVGGGPGAIVSSIVWFAAAWFLAQGSVAEGFAALFVGGMLIFPVSSLFCRFGFGRTASVKGNPLGLIALESTIAMIGALIAAWLLIQSRPDTVMPVAALAVGTHYFAFKTAYGDRTYWLLAAILTLLGCVGLFWLPGRNLILMVAFASVELMFGLVLTMNNLRHRTATAT